MDHPDLRAVYQEQNHIFESSYNVAHDLLTRIQRMQPAEKVHSLERFYHDFSQKARSLQSTKQYMERIIQ